MANRQKNVRLSERGWELLAELSRGYSSEAETIVAALEVLKARNDSESSPHASPGAFVMKSTQDLTVEPVYE